MADDLLLLLQRSLELAKCGQLRSAMAAAGAPRGARRAGKRLWPALPDALFGSADDPSEPRAKAVGWAPVASAASLARDRAWARYCEEEVWRIAAVFRRGPRRRRS